MADKFNISWTENVRDRAISSALSLEPWRDYFKLRAKEMDMLFSMCDIKGANMILEIGCGNGFNACILSKISDKVVATDLLREDNVTHSQGMDTAKTMMGMIGVDNCLLLSCSGEGLPFRDKTFDIVFSMYTLEHIPDRNKMLADVKRVLSEDGAFVTVVPNFIERLYYLVLFLAVGRIEINSISLLFAQERLAQR